VRPSFGLPRAAQSNSLAVLPGGCFFSKSGGFLDQPFFK
jgi:hypothetical protein